MDANFVKKAEKLLIKQSNEFVVVIHKVLKL